MNEQKAAAADAAAVSSPAPAVAETKADGNVDHDGVDYWKAEAQKAFAARQEMKRRLDDLEQQQQQADAARRKAELESAGVETLRQRVAELEPLTGYVRELEAGYQSRLDSALQAVPPALRDRIPKSLPITEQLALVEALHETLRTQTPTVPPAAPVGTDASGRFAAMTDTQLVDYTRGLPDKEAAKILGERRARALGLFGRK